MTKAQIVEQVILALSGGTPTSDMAVKREDVFSLVNAAIEHALFQTDTQAIVNGLRLFRSSGASPQLTKLKPVTYTLTPVEDTSRGDYAITLPGRPYETEVYKVEVSPLKGPSNYVYATDRTQIPRDYARMGLKYYWIEQNPDGVYFARILGLYKPVCDHLVKARLDVTALGDDIELGLPNGVDLRAIEALMAFFQVQKGVIQDFKLNYTDDGQEA